MDQSSFELIIKLLDDRLNRIELAIAAQSSDISEIKKFKWQIIGGGIVLSGFLSVAVSIVSAIISR